MARLRLAGVADATPTAGLAKKLGGVEDRIAVYEETPAGFVNVSHDCPDADGDLDGDRLAYDCSLRSLGFPPF